MLPDPTSYRQNRGARFVLAFALSALLATGLTVGAEGAETVEPGRLWLLRHYKVPGCEPMPAVPTVFNWLIRKALAVEEFLAVSADCGQVGRRGSNEGWTYIFWTESEEAAIARLLRKAQERFGLTGLVAKGMDESFSLRSKGYESFVMIQLAAEDGPVRIWAAGDVVSLKADISIASPGQLRARVESVTHEGRRCVGTRVFRLEDPSGPREAVPCQAGG